MMLPEISLALFTRISEHFCVILNSIEQIMLIWISLERTFPLAELSKGDAFF